MIRPESRCSNIFLHSSSARGFQFLAMPGKELKVYQRSQVAKNNDGKSALIIIKNNVYDVTKFLSEHPGGEEVLLEQAGKDSTDAFEGVGHSAEAREMMKRYRVGEISEEERRKTKDETADYRAYSGEVYGSWRSLLVPVTMGIIATIAYRFYFLGSGH